MPVFKKLILAAFVALFAVSAALAGTMDKDVIRVGTESTYPPYEFRDEDNNLRGLDIDLTEYILGDLDKEIEWVDMPFDSLIPALMSGKIDLIAAGMSATPERAKRVAFTEPYEISLSSFLAVSDRDDLNNLEDLEGKTVAVQLGTVQDTYVTSLSGVTVKRFQKFDDCVREVVLGRADATLMDRPVALEFLKAKDFKGKLKVAFDQEITGAGKAMAIRLDDGAFLDAVNGVLTRMKESGKLEEIRGTWMSWNE